MSAQRTDEVVELLEAFALGEIDLPWERVAAALNRKGVVRSEGPFAPIRGLCKAASVDVGNEVRIARGPRQNRVVGRVPVPRPGVPISHIPGKGRVGP